MAYLTPNVRPQLAKALLDQPSAEAFDALVREYRVQLIDGLMAAPDDHLPGYRGMLLALDNLHKSLQRDALKTVVEKARYG